MVILIDSGVNNPINSALQQKFNKPCKLERQLKNSLIQSILDSDIDFVLSKEQYSNSLQQLKSKYASLPNLKNSAICSTSQSCMNIQSSTSNGTISSTTNHPHFNNVAKNSNSQNSACVNDGIPQPACIIFPSEQVEMSWSPCVFGGTNNFSAVGSGLANLGNTCYLNSTLQCLTYTPPLANYFVKQTTTSTSAPNHAQKCHSQGFCAECEIGKHIKLALSRAYQIYKPLNIVQNLKCIAKHFTPYRQEDAHEFFLHILEAMQKSGLNRFNNNSKLDRFSKHTTLVHQIFGGYLRSRVICQVCKTPSDCYDPYLDISLDVKGTFNMHNALKKFTSPELIQNENAYKCESCKRMVSATKHVNLHRLARVNVFHLKRFTSSGMGKITQFFQYPETIDLAPYLSSSTAVLGKPNKTFINTNSNANTTYSLYAVLVHSGSSTKFGHYFCFCKAQNGSWYRLDDANVTPTSLQKVLSQEAYLLFYIQDTTKRTTPQNIFQTIPNGNLHTSSPPSFNSKQQNLPSKMSPGPNLKLGLVHKNSGNTTNNNNIYVIKPSTVLKQNGSNNPTSSEHRLQEKIILKRSTDTPNSIIPKSGINNPPSESFINTFKFLPNNQQKQQNSTFKNADRKNSDKTATIISGDKKILVPYEESGTSSSHSSDSSPESNFLHSKNCSDIKNLNSTSNHSANSIKTNKIGENSFKDSQNCVLKNRIGNTVSEHDLNQIPLPCENANEKNIENEVTHQQFSPIKIVIKKVKDPSVSNSNNSNTLHKIVAITSNEMFSQNENINKIPNSYGAEINNIENTAKQSSFKNKFINLVKSKNHTTHKTKSNEFSFADKKLASHENIFTNFNDSKNEIPPKMKPETGELLKLNLSSSIAPKNTPMSNNSTNLFQSFNVVSPHKKRKNGQETELNTIEKFNNLSQNEFNSRNSLEKLKKKKKHKKLKRVTENNASNLDNTPSPIAIANTASKRKNMPENSLGSNTENEQSTSNFVDKTGKNSQQSNHLTSTSDFDNNPKEKQSFTQNLSKTTNIPNKTSAPTSFKEEMTKILQSQALSWESSSATITQDLVSNAITTSSTASSNNFKQSSENPKNTFSNYNKTKKSCNDFSGPFPMLTYQKNRDDKKRHKNSQQNYASNSTVVVNPFVKYVTK